MGGKPSGARTLNTAGDDEQMTAPKFMPFFIRTGNKSGPERGIVDMRFGRDLRQALIRNADISDNNFAA